MSRARAFAKVNLALVVGPLRPDGKHEVLTVLQRIDLHDDVELESAEALEVAGFPDDTLVRAALEELASEARVAPGWRVRIEKRIPVAAGLGGGSSDAAAALSLANAVLPRPFAPDELYHVAARIGADVPFFLRDKAQLGSGDGTELAPVELPRDFVVLLALAEHATKTSTADVYRAFDDREGATGFEARRATLTGALARVEHARDLSALPPNDLATSPLSVELERLGAFRADVSGAGPVVYGLFERPDEAERAGRVLQVPARTWVTRPLATG